MVRPYGLFGTARDREALDAHRMRRRTATPPTRRCSTADAVGLARDRRAGSCGVSVRRRRLLALPRLPRRPSTSSRATGLNILTGYTGLVSLGPGGLHGRGRLYGGVARSCAVGTPLLVNLLAAGLVAAVVGVVVGLPCLRVKGLYLAIATIAASVILHFVFAHWTLSPAARAASRCRRRRFFGVALDTARSFYWLICRSRS